ncbi:MAG: chemotaxis protein CheB [Acidobacteriaceae bacterium]
MPPTINYVYGSVHCYAFRVPAIKDSRANDVHKWLQIPHVFEFKAFDIVVIAASAGGISALGAFLSGLPACFPAPVVIAQHLSPRSIYESRLDCVLERRTALNVKWADDGEIPRAGTVYLSPQDRLTVIDSSYGALCTTRTSGLQRTTPRANPLFDSAAEYYGHRTLALVLSGALEDGANGAMKVKEAGGRVLVQSYLSAQFDDMPKAAMKNTRVALAFDPLALAHVVVTLVMAPGASDWFRVSDQRNLIMEG